MLIFFSFEWDCEDIRARVSKSPRAGRAFSQETGNLEVPPSAPKNIPAKQPTLSLSPFIRVAYRLLPSKLEPQRKAAHKAKPKALGERHPPSPGAMAASSNQSKLWRSDSRTALSKALGVLIALGYICFTS